MSAYINMRVKDFLEAGTDDLLGRLQKAYATDGFASLYTSQTRAWNTLLAALKNALHVFSEESSLRVLLEFPLYRLRRRIDVVILVNGRIVVVEAKVGSASFESTDRRQVEEYALDLRDFHAGSFGRELYPVLWATNAKHSRYCFDLHDDGVAPVQLAGADGLCDVVQHLLNREPKPPLDGDVWDAAPYRPIPSIIQAATVIFARHDVRAIARADASNLADAAARLVQLVAEARREHRRYLLMLTGVPGSGKTLVGLQVVHDAIATGADQDGDIIYLSGNTPLVTVLREALARDQRERLSGGSTGPKIGEIRRQVRGRIQHINDFLKDNLQPTETKVPHEHVVVFDEAQRAWDEKQGADKFGRSASEPSLLLEIMSRHKGWCVVVCLLGQGQEINSGEDGIAGWGEAIRRVPKELVREWTVKGPDGIFKSSASAGLSLGDLPDEVTSQVEEHLELRVPQRSYRSPLLSQWVDAVLDGDAERASDIEPSALGYPIVLTRSLDDARAWLRSYARGHRRVGLAASSGARRLRGEGLGSTLNANAGLEIAHWYLNEPGDVRSCFALEVPANEYTAQGLELDFVGLCWGGDMLRQGGRWHFARLNGTKWQRVKDTKRVQYVINTYRVLFTRAREGLVLFVPGGAVDDSTRRPEPLDQTARFLLACGVKELPSSARP